MARRNPGRSVACAASSLDGISFWARLGIGPEAWDPSRMRSDESPMACVADRGPLRYQVEKAGQYGTATLSFPMGRGCVHSRDPLACTLEPGRAQYAQTIPVGSVHIAQLGCAGALAYTLLACTPQRAQFWRAHCAQFKTNDHGICPRAATAYQSRPIVVMRPRRVGVGVSALGVGASTSAVGASTSVAAPVADAAASVGAAS